MIIPAVPEQYRDKAPLFGALIVSSLLSLVLFAGRVEYSAQWTFVFLVWNLFLAWLPLGCALALWHLHQRKRRSIGIGFALFGAWLLFFPNAPYLVTDLIHLTQRHNVPLWYDMLLLFSFAWNGLILGFVSLWIVQGVVQSCWGGVASWLVVGVSLAGGGFGIYLGRFLRWNSWDLFVNPQGLAADILVRVLNPFAHPRTLAVTMLFAAFLTVAYLTIRLLSQVRWQPIDPGESIPR
ncbi:MAG: DUF1361 domain-containing protein [Chloroflexota bacterium]|nr:DUF1361 domain-containing protein [Chloroflexota bacterium]